MYPLFWEKGREVTNAMAESMYKDSIDDEKSTAVVEIANWASRVTLDIIGVAGMGQDFNAIKNPSNELYQTYQKIFSPSRAAQILGMLSIFLPLWLIRMIPTKRNDDIEDASRVIKRVCYDLIEQKKQQLAKGDRTDVDILAVALESGGFTEELLGRRKPSRMLVYIASRTNCVQSLS